MPFDPTLPVNNSLISSSELRNQFTGLNELIDNVQNQLISSIGHGRESRREYARPKHLQPADSGPSASDPKQVERID
jgi:hypothetical protein